MPRFSEMIESKYLKKEDLADSPDGRLCTIVGFKRVNVAQEDQPEEFKYIVKFRELEKPMVLNPTNIQLLEKATGCATAEEAKGKQVWVYIDDNVQYQGKLIGGIRIKRVPTQAPAPRPAASSDGFEDEDTPIQQPAPRASARQQRVEDFEDDIPF